ncbi:hypothetical protein CROQUDRAFT_658135 [Cronartium quercuum f. sp. fusiforme G11]|uniref:Pre-mRNA-splicing factor CWC26 n=1 Tax=Cronartium quercuum f. sp. fusiforme G11 TaxID=708437 RepID=A0A9P6TB49_9BASI|nr:hypothetical protein CROQUDRAFT_658135 [Cronartium quercuum f. sp. fusiforme G11]
MADGLQAYLASKYMSGPKADAILTSLAPDSSRRKRKKKHRQDHIPEQSSSGFIIKDADDEGWDDKNLEDDQLEPVVETIASFKAKSKVESNWTVIKPSGQQESEEIETIAEDEQPQIVGSVTEQTIKGGLQTADEIKAHLKTKQAKNSQQNTQDDNLKGEEEQETVYRDSSGRKIDTKQLRAEEKRRKARELEKSMRKMEWGKGLVQRDDKKATADELSKIAAQPFARTIDDREMNEELKDVRRWNDPAAGFLTKPTKSSSKPSRPKYNGPPPPPNRYSIQPGFRWDGVDRSNGFEKKLFATGNEQKRNKAEAYSYSVDDM